MTDMTYANELNVNVKLKCCQNTLRLVFEVTEIYNPYWMTLKNLTRFSYAIHSRMLTKSNDC